MWITCDWCVNKGAVFIILLRVWSWRIEYCVNFCRWIPLDWHQIWANTRHIYRRFITKFSSVLSKFKQHYIFLSSQISWHHCFGNRDSCFDDETTGQWRLSPGKITLHTCHNMMTSWQWGWHALVVCKRSALLALCEWNPAVIAECHSQTAVMWSGLHSC